MTISTFSSREFNQDVSKAKKAALSGPTFITDRGHIAYVLLAIEDYQRIINKKENIVDLLAMPSAANIDFEPEPLKGRFYYPADLT